MRLFFTCLLVSFLGCNDNTLIKVVDVKPEIIVHPREIFFGHIKSGLESETEMITIMNVGNSDLYVNPDLMDGSTRYQIGVYTNDDLLLHPGDILDIPVTYIPVTYEHNGAIVRVLSNDEENPEIDVLLEGFGDAPKIEITPEIIDYGQISIGCDNEYRVTIENVGNLDLEVISAIQMTTLPNDMYVDYGALPDPPWSLIPEEQIDLLIKYEPSDIGYDESVVSIESNDPQRHEIEITQSGKGVAENWIIDEWIQEEERIYDIVWVIDNSGSMNMFHTNLMSNMNMFFNTFFSQQDINFRMGFITTDQHYLVNGSFIDSQTQNPSIAATSLISSIGINGSGTEMGLRKFYEFLDFYTGTNFFLREEAQLVVIFVSDEDDHSPLPVLDYITDYGVLKGYDKLKAYGVIGDYPTGCNISNGNFSRNASFGSRYYSVITHFSGDWFSICAHDWSSQMSSIANDIIANSKFDLSESDPIPETIEVYVNGQAITSNWSYDNQENAVIFDQNNTPQQDQTIRIEYATYGCGGFPQ